MKQVDEKLIASIVDSLKLYLKSAGYRQLVIGLSGGIDSALSAVLAVKAVGRENVHAYFMPHRESSPVSRDYAQIVATYLGLELTEIDITPMADGYAMNWEMTPLRTGNLASRLRMMILFDQSVRHNALVLGTGNKSEILLGYMTWFGDSACSVNPLGDVYKTQVFGLARLLGMPREIIDRAPSADHYADQTDEGDLGYSYAEIDKLLEDLYEGNKSPETLTAQGYDPKFVSTVVSRMNANAYKRKVPYIINTGQRPV